VKKPVSMTVNGCAVIVALLAWLDTAIGRTPAPVGYLKAHFGAVGDGIADDTGAVTAWRRAASSAAMPSAAGIALRLGYLSSTPA